MRLYLLNLRLNLLIIPEALVNLFDGCTVLFFQRILLFLSILIQFVFVFQFSPAVKVDWFEVVGY
jgi:hypothetical protein